MVFGSGVLLYYAEHSSDEKEKDYDVMLCIGGRKSIVV